MIEKQSEVFDLSEELEYTNTTKGVKEKTAQIEMLAPTYKTSKSTYKLAQYFMRATMAAQQLQNKELVEEAEKVKNENEEDSENTFGVESIRIIFFASSVSFDKVVDEFICIANKICFLDSERNVP